MASIQSLGVGSGLLTTELVEQIIEAERAPVEARLNASQALAEAKISAFGEISSALSGFDAALQSLTLPSTFNASQVSSSNEGAVTGTASSIATTGSYTVSVSQLAQSHAIASAAYESVSSTVGTGILSFRFGTIDFGVGDSYDGFTLNPDTTPRSVVISSGNNTLAGIRDAVNNAKMGVQASIVDDGSGFRLVFSATKSGASNSMEIVASGSNGLQALNYNHSSHNASLNAVTASGALDLVGGGGLDVANLGFTLSYQGEALSVEVASDPGIVTTAAALLAIQEALNVALVAAGFDADAVVASADGDMLYFQTAATGFDQTLEVLVDGTAAVLSGGAALSDGFDFASNNASFSISVDGAAPEAIVLNTATASREETVDLVNAALLGVGLSNAVLASLDANNALVFTRLTTGAASSLAISGVDALGTGASTELGLVADSVDGLDGFGLNAAEGLVSGSVRLEQSIAAQNALFSVNGLTISRASNLVTGVVTGTTLNLKSVTTGSVTLTVSKDASAISTRLSAFVDSYNQLKGLADQLTAFDPNRGNKGQGSLLTGDSTLRMAMAEINRILRSSVSGLTGDIRALSEIGITSNQNAGYKLEFDSNVFAEKFADDPGAILALFATAGSTTDSLITYNSATADSLPGTYAINITRLASTGAFTGKQVASLAAGNIVIGADNDEFTVLLNGVSADIQLTAGTYATAALLAEHIQTSINSNADLAASGHAVAVTYNSVDQRFELASNRYGSSSNIGFLAVDSAMADSLGLVSPLQGAYLGNQLGGLSTPSGLSSENFDAPVLLNAQTSFILSVNGVQSGLLTVPGSSDTPVSYATPDALLAAISGVIAADPAFQPTSASTGTGDVLLAGQDFATTPLALVLSLDGGATETELIINGDAANVSFDGQTPGTIANTLAAVQDAIDASALNGQVLAQLDGSNQLYFTTVATGAASQIEVMANGTPARVQGSAAVDALGFDFAGSNASFEIDIDGEGPVAIVVNLATTDPADTLAKVQAAITAAGLAAQVTVVLDDSDQLVFTYAAGRGAGTQIEILNANATAIAELGISDQLVTGIDGPGIPELNATGEDGIDITVSYSYDEETEYGRLVFSTASLGDEISFSAVSVNAGNKLGLVAGSNPSPSASDGVDVAGEINGIEAVGLGQYLRASGGNITAEPGYYLNAAPGNLASSTTNDSFRLSVDGVLSNAITLGTISNTAPAAVAASMQVAINNSPALLAAGVSVSVQVDATTGGFLLISNSTGAASRVSVADLQGNAGVIFGFNTGVGAFGAAGINASGEPDAATGLRLLVAGGALGARGSVSYIKGVAENLSRLLDNYLGSSGVFATRTNSLNLELAKIGEKREALDERIARSEARLRTSFLANDKIISQLNTTADFLTSQLAMLEVLASNRNKKN